MKLRWRCISAKGQGKFLSRGKVRVRALGFTCFVFCSSFSPAPDLLFLPALFTHHHPPVTYLTILSHAMEFYSDLESWNWVRWSSGWLEASIVPFSYSVDAALLSALFPSVSCS